MDARRIGIALVLALVLSGGATYFLYTRLRGTQARPEVTKIVAAAHAVPAGAAIKVDDVALIDWPLNIPLAGSFSKVDDVVGRALIYPLGEKEPVLQRDLAEPGSGIGLSVKIPPGMRATSIRSNEIVGVAGFLFPGSHVDVLDTYTPPGGGGGPITETVLQNVEVITAGQKIQPDPQGKPETVSVVTLLLTPKDSEKLLLASSQGNVQFVLRNGADTDQVKTPAVSLADLMGVVKPPTPVVTRTSRARAPKVVPTATPPPDFYTIEIIQGKERSEQKFPEGAPK
jgi:pilus assembly protein CpaB